MFVLIVGCGRVGSTVAKWMLAEGHEVSVLDEDPEAHRPARQRPGRRAGRTWAARFTVGTALEIDALLEAGIDEADVFIASTDGDNTNLVIAQIAQRRFEVEKVVVRVLDPAARRVVRRAGPADGLPDRSRDRHARGRRCGSQREAGGCAMYVIDRRRRARWAGTWRAS